MQNSLLQELLVFITKITLILKNFELLLSMCRETANNALSEVRREDGGRDAPPDTACERAIAGGSRRELSLMPQWTLGKHSRYWASMIDVDRYGNINQDGGNLVVYNRDRFEWDNTWRVEATMESADLV